MKCPCQEDLSCSVASYVRHVCSRCPILSQQQGRTPWCLAALQQEELITHILRVTMIQDVISRVNVSWDPGQGIGVLESVIVCWVFLWFAEVLACLPCR